MGMTKQITMADVLAKYYFDSCPPEFRADWGRLLHKREPGDELWLFSPPPDEIELWGIALVRNGEVISTLVEAVS
jgi:hypothetical protein